MDEQYPQSDRLLIEACIKRDLVAWSNLLKKYLPLVCLSIENRLKKYGITVARHDIEDIKQTVLTDIWENNKLKTIINREDISYWVAIVSGNAAMEYFRGTAAHQARKTIYLSDKVKGKELGELFPSGRPDPKDELQRAETEGMVDEAVKSLPEKERLIIELYLFHDKKYHEIADMIGVPKGTVSSHIKRAKEKLRKELKNY